MQALSTMRAHVTPIPTPPAVRFGTSALMGTAVASLTTSWPHGLQVAAVLVLTGAGILLIFSHPYRREMRAFLEQRNLQYRMRFGQMVPLMIVWLALMLAPLLAPLPIIGSLLVGVGVFAWLWWTFPHVDGTRALAFVDEGQKTRASR